MMTGLKKKKKDWQIYCLCSEGLSANMAYQNPFLESAAISFFPEIKASTLKYISLSQTLEAD